MTSADENPKSEYYSTNHDSNVLRIFIIRHGQTAHNVQKILQGHKDTSINEKGTEQGATLGRYLREQGIHFDRVFSSDLKRCQETLAAIQEAQGETDVPVVLTPALRERHMGVIEGMHLSAAEEYADKHGRGSFRDFGENIDEFTERLTGGITKAVDESNADGLENIALVSHGGAIRTILRWLDHDAENFLKIIVFNTSVTVVDYLRDSKQFKVRCVGDTHHLGDGKFIVSDLRLR